MLSISDTRHINHDVPPKLQFYPDLSAEFYDDENVNENQPVLSDLKGGSEQGGISQRSDEEKPAQAAAAPQNTENTSEYLQEFAKYSDEAAKLIESNKPAYDQERENRLKRLGRAQKFTDAFSILAQAIGANAGASVPQMQMNNSQSTSEAIRRMRELHENEKQRYDLMNFQERLRGLQYKQQTAMQGHEREMQNAEYNRRSEADNDPTTIENQLKREKQDNDNLESKARAGYYNAGTSSRNAFADNETASTANKNDPAKKPYLTLYDDLNSEPSFIVRDEGHALSIFNKIIAANPKNLDLQKYIDEAPTKAQVDAVISRYWKTVIGQKPTEKPAWLPSKNRAEGQEYRPAAVERKENAVKWLSSPENQKSLDDFVSKVETNYPGQTNTQKAAIRTYLVKNAGFELEEANRIVEDYFTNIED